MKKKVLFMCLISAIGISGCGKQPAANPVPSQSVTSRTVKEVLEEDKDFEAHFNEIIIEGNTISFPCSYQEITESGFKFLDAYLKYADVIPTGTSWAWKNGEKDHFEMRFRSMGKNGKRPLEECEAVQFIWMPAIDRTFDITFYGGINADSTREDMKKFLHEDQRNEYVSIYSRYLEGSDKGIIVYFTGEQLSKVVVRS